MRCIARKDHAAMHIVRQGQRAGRVDRTPVHLPGCAAKADHLQLRINTRLERLGLERIFRVFARRQLVVHTPDAMRLPVHEDGVAGVPGRIEKGQSLRGQRQVDADIGNHKTAFVRSAFHLQIHGRANARACAIAGNQPVGLQLVYAFRRIYLNESLLTFLRTLLLNLVDAVAPTQIDQRVSLSDIDQIFLQILLLQIDHGEEAVIVSAGVFHAEHALAAINTVTKAPRQARLRHAMGHAHLLQNFHGAARKHNGATAFGDLQF